jgi:hypothetical protein
MQAQQLGSLALNAKRAFQETTKKAEDTADEAMSMTEQRMAADNEAKELKEALRLELERLEDAEEALAKTKAAEKAKADAESKAAEGSELTEETAPKGQQQQQQLQQREEMERLAVEAIQARVQELEEFIAAKRDMSMMLLQEKEELIKSVGLLQQEAVSLEISMMNAENIAASAMEAAADGVTFEVECDEEVAEIELQLQELVKNLRVEVMKKQKEKEKARLVEDKAKMKETEVAKDEGQAKLVMDSDENMLRDVEAMESLVLRSICEVTRPSSPASFQQGRHEPK